MLKRLLSAGLALAITLSSVGNAFADTTVTVQAGDTLSGIAARCGVTVQSILTANRLTNPNLVVVGQVLRIPGVSSCAGAPAPAPGGGNPSAPTPAPSTGGEYVVVAGDSLGRIAARFGTTVQAIVAANNLRNPDQIFVGQRLRIPGGSAPAPAPTTPPAGGNPPSTSAPTTGEYVVQAGDSLGRIASRFNTTVQAILSANSLTNPNLIFVGQRLRIPGGTGSAPPPAGSTPAPNQPVPPPTQGFSGFQLGGHAQSYTYANQMRFAGMSWIKKQVRWSPGANPNDWAGTINEAKANGFRILLGVVGSPDSIRDGNNYGSYAEYVAGLARLGADGIEVWNEPNIDREWPTGQIQASRYVDLLRQAYTAIKAANPNTIVISGAPAPTGAEGAFGADRVRNDDAYMREMAAAGGASYMDCIGIHYNEGIVGPTQNSGDPRGDYYTRYYQGMVSTYYNAFGGRRPLCFTELGYLTPEGMPGPLPGPFSWASNVTLAQQAQWLGQAANLARSSGIVRLMIVWNVDFTRYDDDPMAGYAIIRPGGGCPACDALRAVTGGR